MEICLERRNQLSRRLRRDDYRWQVSRLQRSQILSEHCLPKQAYLDVTWLIVVSGHGPDA